jgi:protein O-mannosyl-transferase
MLPPLLIATAIAYYPAWHGGLLWDDAAHLTHPALQSLRGLWRIWTDIGATQQYYPLAHSVFWLQDRLWGDAVLGYHLVNIALHATSAFLLALILRRLSIPGAFIAAFLFALHPLQVESVAWISELKNTLSTMFYLAAALLYLRFDDTRNRRHYAAALALFVCALFTKTVTATLPAALLVVFWWRRGTLNVRRDVVPLIPFFVAGISAGLLTAWVERHLIGAQGAGFDLTLIERLLIAGRVVWFYASKIVWPHPLVFVYPRWAVSAEASWQFLFPLAVVALLIAFWLMRGRTRTPLAVMLLFCGALFPALGFVDVYPFRFSFVADHFAYLATIPVIALIAAGLARLPSRGPVIAPAIVGIVLGALTWRQSGNYASAETLYRATVSENPNAWIAHNNLGKLLAEQGRNGEARLHFSEALDLEPNVAEHHMNLGRLAIAEDSLAEGIRHLEAALEIEPGNADGLNNLGVALLRQKKQDAAISRFEEALRIDPDHGEARDNLVSTHRARGVALAQAGDLEQARHHFEAAMRYRPDDAAIRYNLGTALLALGRNDEAVIQLEEALRIQPSFPQAEANLAAARAAGR